MISIYNELQIRKNESDNLIVFLEQIEHNRFHFDEETSINVTSLRTTLKSTTIIVLYNSVESLITQCLTKIHNEIIRDNLLFENININLKKLFMHYYEKAIANCSNQVKIVEYKYDYLQLTGNREQIKISYSDIISHYSLFSGNLDSRKIKDVLSKYGLSFDVAESVLKTIKTYRNQLAHGEKSFEEVGRELSVPQLRAMHTRTFDYLNAVADAVRQFISNKDYRS